MIDFVTETVESRPKKHQRLRNKKRLRLEKCAYSLDLRKWDYVKLYKYKEWFALGKRIDDELELTNMNYGEYYDWILNFVRFHNLRDRYNRLPFGWFRPKKYRDTFAPEMKCREILEAIDAQIANREWFDWVRLYPLPYLAEIQSRSI